MLKSAANVLKPPFDGRASVVVMLTVAGVVLFGLMPTLGGYFLGDDFSYIYSVSQAFDRGELWIDCLRQFTQGLRTGGDYYYRPLTYCSFTIQYWLHGGSALGYRFANVALHSTNAALVAYVFLVLGRRYDAAPSSAAASVAGIVFGLSPSSLEVSAWVSGRFDALATFFLLLTIVFFFRQDRWKYCSAAFLGLGLMSKESAMMAVPFAGLIAFGDAWRSPTSMVAALRQVAVRITPLVLVTTAYLIARWLMFGTSLRVYADSDAPSSLLNGAWIGTLRSLPAWFTALCDGSAASILLMLCAMTASITLLLAAWQEERHRRVIAVLVTSLAVAYPMVFANAPGFSPDGRNGRLFYQILIPVSCLLALPMIVVARRSTGSGIQRVVLTLIQKAYPVILLGCVIWLFVPVMAKWHDIGIQSTALRNALGTTAERLDQRKFGVVFAPDWNRNIPFALNAVGGFVLPPFQAEPLYPRLILQTQREFGSLTGLTESGLVTRLKKGARSAILGEKQPEVVVPTVEWPDYYWCWRGEQRSLGRMSTPRFTSHDRYVQDLAAAYSRCVHAD